MALCSNTRLCSAAGHEGSNETPRIVDEDLQAALNGDVPFTVAVSQQQNGVPHSKQDDVPSVAAVTVDTVQIARMDTAPEPKPAPAVVFKNDLLDYLLIGGTEYIQDQYGAGDIICQFCCYPWAAWRRYAGMSNTGEKATSLTFQHSCLPLGCCLYDWHVVRDDHQTLGMLRAASLCDNGCFGCLCPCLRTGKTLMMKFVTAAGVPIYSTRADLTCCTSFYQYVGACCYHPLHLLCIHPVNYCSGTPYHLMSLPFYSEKESGVDASDGQEPVGDFVFV